MFSNHKVISVKNCARKEIASSAAREKPMTIDLINSLIDQEGKTLKHSLIIDKINCCKHYAKIMNLPYILIK